jgi:hypothetical protein
MALLAAASGDGVLGGLIESAGLGLLFLADGSVIGYYLIGIGIFVSLVGLVSVLASAGPTVMAGGSFAPGSTELNKRDR